MSNILEHGSNDPEPIQVGGLDGSQVSLKTYQDIYHQITGKKEELRKSYKDSFCIEYSDIQQLHTKIVQLLDIYNVVAINESITVYYEKERKEQYSSFEKFSAFNANGTSPVSSVVLKFDLSIVPAKLKQPQEYTVTIRLSSRMSQLREIQEDAPPFVQGSFISMMVSETAEIRIEYADYIIARGFIETFNEWMKGCKKTKENSLIKWGQKYSLLIPPVGKILVSMLYGFFIYLAIDPIIGANPSFVVFSKYFVVSSISFYLAINLSNLIFKSIERLIDSYTFTSWIKLNKGDENAIEDLGKSKNKNLLLFGISSLGVVFLGVISSQISSLIDKLT